MWYEKSYRRHLADMHIADWNEEFLSKFSPENYVANLKLANVQNAMIYLQSHAGLCYWNTASGVMHKALTGREDLIKRTVDLCHKNGMTVVGYYSLNYNTVEHDKHPSWRLVNENGKTSRSDANSNQEQKLDFASLQFRRYGVCCPNNKEYREFVFKQIDEMLDYFDLEGLFFDMPFWPSTCYCENCRSRYKKETGYDFPYTVMEGSEEHKRLIERKFAWMGEWIQLVTDHCKKRNPNISVEHNFAASFSGTSDYGCGEEVNKASDFIGGDLYGGCYSHSLACKFFKNITQNAPFDYMLSRCKPALRSHTLTKTEDELKIQIMLNAMHHGATLFIDAIDPIGTFDKRVYERLGKVYSYEEKYEKYFNGTMVEDIGVYYGMRSKINNYNYSGFNNKKSCLTIAQNFSKHHIPYGVTGNFHGLDGYKLVIIPMLSDLESADNDRIIDYVSNGGNVYISGVENGNLVEKLIGGTLKGYSEEKNVYIAPEKEYEETFMSFNKEYPLPFDSFVPFWELGKDNDAKVIAKLVLPYTKPNDLRFASIHSNPPGIWTEYPAVVIKKMGKGQVIWSALPIETNEIYEYRETFINLINCLVNKEEYSFKTNINGEIEITEFEEENFYTINVIAMTDEAVVKKVSPFEVKVKVDKKPKSVELLPSETSIDFSYDNGYVTFTTRELKIFDMYRIVK